MSFGPRFGGAENWMRAHQAGERERKALSLSHTLSLSLFQESGLVPAAGPFFQWYHPPNFIGRADAEKLAGSCSSLDFRPMNPNNDTQGFIDFGLTE